MLRFAYFSAEALAYLNDTAGVDVLGEAASRSRSSGPTPWRPWPRWTSRPSHMKLRKLMDEPDVEVRYGAFNALRTLDPTDPFLGLVARAGRARSEDDEDEPPDSMAMAIAEAAQRRRTARKIRSGCTSSIRKGRRWCTCRARAAARSSSSGGRRSC